MIASGIPTVRRAARDFNGPSVILLPGDRRSSCFCERGLPPGTVSDHMQEPPGVFHVARVARVDGFPGVAGRASCRNIKHRHEPVLPVRPVVGQLGLGDDPNNGRGGRGGNAHAIGVRLTAIGGYGGRGGVGPGGDGGHGRATGHGSVSIGGDGAQPGGMGGRARGPAERSGFPSYMWGPGRGGRGSCMPEFIRLREMLSDIYTEYLERFRNGADLGRR